MVAVACSIPTERPPLSKVVVEAPTLTPADHPIPSLDTPADTHKSPEHCVDDAEIMLLDVAAELTNTELALLASFEESLMSIDIPPPATGREADTDIPTPDVLAPTETQMLPSQDVLTTFLVTVEVVKPTDGGNGTCEVVGAVVRSEEVVT